MDASADEQNVQELVKTKLNYPDFDGNVLDFNVEHTPVSTRQPNY